MEMSDVTMRIKKQFMTVFSESVAKVKIFAVKEVFFIPPANPLPCFFFEHEKGADTGFEGVSFIFIEMAKEIAGKSFRSGEKFG